MDKCPYCGSEKSGPYNWVCGTWERLAGDDYEIHRGSACYETQLAAQQELLRRCREVVEAVAQRKCCVILSEGYCRRRQRKNAAALLLDFDQALKEKP